VLLFLGEVCRTVIIITSYIEQMFEFLSCLVALKFKASSCVIF
jgi:hypothetical protein